ncbi:hypothetical protein C8R48DRAFT_737876 [Suillus tomentosus]|nr:hypothetical protein C8R48DRAFT_737876 [Suillus tomentosus]
MNIFNPRILDASIRDVTGCLSDVQKADVLLHALQHLPSEGFRIVMENAIQSFLQVSGVPPADLFLIKEPEGPPRFSAEVWREIALCLPKRDLKSLLLLIFRETDLHFTASPDPPRAENRYRDVNVSQEEQELNAWHCQRSADILTRILVDPVFASQVRNLSVYAVSDTSHTLAFQAGLYSLFSVTVSQSSLGMSINSLPKLCNLRSARFLVNRSGDINIPPFKHITHFSITAEGGNSTSTHDFISQSRDNLRSLSIKNANCKFPTDAISVPYLTIIEFEGCFSVDSQVFSEILSAGHQLQSLTLSGILECTPSATFRLHRSSLPFLMHYALKFISLHRHVTDRDLVPATSEFLRDRKHLHSFHLIVPSGDHRRIGFDASAWGVLPSLTNLRSLYITYPRDLSPSLARWLIPRSVHDLLLFINQLCPGVPPLLTFIGMTNFPIRSVINVIDQGFSNVQLVRIDDNVWSVIRLDNGSIEVMEQWPYQRIKYHSAAWLEFLECEDAI